MKGETGERRRNLLWGIPASLILHALVAGLLIYGLPTPRQQPQEEEPVNVALVPPPEQPKPKPAPVPSPKPPEPRVEKPPEQKVEKPAPQPRKPLPIEVLKPVFQFGDKDAGPRKSLDGASAQDSSPSPTKDEESKPPVVQKPAETQSDVPAGTEKPPDLAEAGEKPVADAKDTQPAQDKQATLTQDADKQQDAKQQAGVQDAAKQTGAAPTPLATDGGGEVELPISAAKPEPKPTNTPKPSSSKVAKSRNGGAGSPGSTDVASAASRRYSGLPGVRRLYSQGATGDALATTSMGGVPRGQRGAKLCASALQQQLLDASYFPILIPSVPLKAGNVLDAPDVAFRTSTTWFHLGFRCEVDSDATRVLSFDFRVGAVIPPGEWARLGLPAR
ncbi:DUF930 domain-containing protein [Mesorhizobium sp. B2-3-13]|uniref:DUF930 domain-containing protein n=1 Tax=unclassified Mesorhizobium TaxID=325217 RepID=UPI00112DAFB1|nr:MULTISPECIES: DUF930 domain-containing protein [unclassified Mesorhizobium]TPL90099.1 DUF930 domain-containing protein [Mesorhizobium sp. B2-3-13]TPM07707.1 DUF930 domain-containing protein [Mesorhizobium sp. B2-3-11]